MPLELCGIEAVGGLEQRFYVENNLVPLRQPRESRVGVDRAQGFDSSRGACSVVDAQNVTAVVAYLDCVIDGKERSGTVNPT